MPDHSAEPDIALDAYAARTCPVKTWNRFAPHLERPQNRAYPRPDEGLRDSFDGGLPFAAGVQAQILASVPDEVADLRELRGSPSAAQIEACLVAMAHGVPVILGGLLPIDHSGHRLGRADLWIRGADQVDGRPGYHPVKIQRRLIAEKRQSGATTRWALAVSPLDRPLPGQAHEVEDRVIRTSRDGALLQVAHYWRLLQAAGFAAAGRPRAGIVGTDDLLGDGRPAVTWFDLDEPMIRTFSRTAETGWRLRTILERYDHEHQFRVDVARNALSGEDPVVTPIRNRECDSCDWWGTCRQSMDADDLSIRIDKAPLDIREISTLRGLGIRTITDLAGVDLTEIKPLYLPEVRHREAAERRLETAARRARLMVDSVDLERLTTGPIDLPTADIEIDFDIETAQDDRVYLWGFLVNDTQTGDPPVYQEFSAWHELDRAGEAALAARALGWLRSMAEGPASVRVYHYSPYEVTRIGQLRAAHPGPLLDWAQAFARTSFCDLFTVMRDHWFGARGLGLKVVASVGAGFEWRDADPGGLNSQTWFAEACSAPDPEQRRAARQRVLDYNEDDVRATHQLRSWLRDQS